MRARESADIHTYHSNTLSLGLCTKLFLSTRRTPPGRGIVKFIRTSNYLESEDVVSATYASTIPPISVFQENRLKRRLDSILFSEEEKESEWNPRVRKSCADCSKIGTETCVRVQTGFVCKCRENFTVFC